ncbi:unnamed protein product, partial [Prorocentrum cordatum]
GGDPAGELPAPEPVRRAARGRGRRHWRLPRRPHQRALRAPGAARDPVAAPPAELDAMSLRRRLRTLHARGVLERLSGRRGPHSGRAQQAVQGQRGAAGRGPGPPRAGLAAPAALALRPGDDALAFGAETVTTVGPR